MSFQLNSGLAILIALTVSFQSVTLHSQEAQGSNYRSSPYSAGSIYLPKTAPDGSPIIPCVVQLVTDIDIPAQETGLLTEILVKENQAVELGQKLGQIDDRMSQRAFEQASLKHELATKRASDNSEINSAKRKKLLTASEYETNLNLYRKGSKTKQEAQRSLYSKQISEYEFDAAVMAKELANVESKAEMVNKKAALDSIERHKIKSPINGNVFKIYKETGEWVQAGEKIMRVAPLRKLRVHGTVSAKNWDPREIDGKPVTVSVSLARNRIESFSGQIVQTELEQRGNNLYLVIAEIENRLEPNSNHWILQPLSRVEMTIHVNTPPNAQPSFGN